MVVTAPRILCDCFNLISNKLHMLGPSLACMRRVLKSKHTYSSFHQSKCCNFSHYFFPSINKSLRRRSVRVSSVFYAKTVSSVKTSSANHAIRCSRVARRIQCHRVEIIASWSSSCQPIAESHRQLEIKSLYNENEYVWMKMWRSCQRPISDPNVKWMR